MARTGLRHALVVLVLAIGSTARAQAPDPAERAGEPDPARDGAREAEPPELDEPVSDDPSSPAVTFRASARADPSELRARATSTVDRQEMEERVVRSTPDALRGIPGVSVQQTAHGQASPYVRALTGQQVLLLFDGIRINNGIFRQGPNQYFFTVDQATVERLHVIRGSASTRWGSDALGGAILTAPREPTLDPTRDEVIVHPRAYGRFGSQDLDLGGRGEIDIQLGPEVAFLGGAGYRAAGPLQASGIVCSLSGPTCVPANRIEDRMNVPMVPLIENDGRTQRGTGFRVLSWDGRLVWRPSAQLRVTAAAYGFHQFDSPRTDQCPPPFAPGNDCLRHREQTRVMSYVAVDLRPGGDIADFRVVGSWQHVYEDRERDRPTAFVINSFRDAIDTFGLTMRGRSRAVSLANGLAWQLEIGGDAYVDRVRSDASITFTDVRLIVPESRGQYVDRGVFGLAGVWAESVVSVERWLTIRSGARLMYAGARAGSDPRSGTRAVDVNVGGVVGRASLEARPIAELALIANVDQGIRAPNLDDLTSRQQAGPGFQFENPALREERTTSYELGVRVLPIPELEIEGWAYATQIDGAITRVLRDASNCPPATPRCGASWSRFQLENAGGESWVLGGELSATLRLDEIGLRAIATLSGAWGEGPSPGDVAVRAPLSRVPPVNGMVDARWRYEETGVSVAATFRWALEQTRLAPADLGDARIPLGGTPGYGTLDLRAGWELAPYLDVNVVFENVFDQPYRVHGSSINGPGRGVLIGLEAGF